MMKRKEADSMKIRIQVKNTFAAKSKEVLQKSVTSKVEKIVSTKVKKAG